MSKRSYFDYESNPIEVINFSYSSFSLSTEWESGYMKMDLDFDPDYRLIDAYHYIVAVFKAELVADSDKEERISEKPLFKIEYSSLCTIRTKSDATDESNFVDVASNILFDKAFSTFQSQVPILSATLNIPTSCRIPTVEYQELLDKKSD